MKEVIYYPGFHVQNLDWLKFAILYLDRLIPIIPEAGDKHPRQWYKQGRDDTELIFAHRPTVD